MKPITSVKILLALLCSSLIASISAAAVTVNSTGDPGNGVCDATECTLREAIGAAAAGDTIDFSVTGGIVLNGSAIAITRSVNITGPGATSLAIDGNNQSAIFTISGAADVTLANLTLTRGRTLTGRGGAVDNNSSGSLTVSSCVFSNNVTVAGASANLPIGRGGAIAQRNSGALNIISSTFSGNSASGVANAPTGGGGAIFSENAATVNVTDSVFSGNFVNVPNSARGGAIAGNLGRLNLSGSTLTNNTVTSSFSSADGGAISGFATVDVANSTITSNQVNALDSQGLGGGISAGGGATLILRDGSVISQNEVRGLAATGGGVYRNGVGTATISDTTVRQNLALASAGDATGGGLALNAGNGTQISRSVIDANRAETTGTGTRRSYGGGIHMTGSTSGITDSSVLNNVATSLNDFTRGAGLYTEVTVNVVRTTFSANSASGKTAAAGGAVYLTRGETVNATNSTFDGNTVATTTASGTASGGAFEVLDNCDVNLRNSTIVRNSATAPSGGTATGGGVNLFDNSAIATVRHTIIALNTASTSGPNINGAVLSTGYNLVGDSSGSSGLVGPGDQVNVADPKLAPLANYGGLTATVALLTGSPAINAGDPNFPTAGDPPLTTDQRGAPFPRVRAGRIDIGAYEAPPPPVITGPASGTRTNGSPSVTGTAEPQSTVTVTFTRGSTTVNVTTTADANGNFTATASGLTDGDYVVMATAGFSSSEIAVAPAPSNSTTIVVDTVPPVISGTPGDITVEATSAAGATVTYQAPSANDNVDGARPVNCAPASGSTFALGTTLVTCSASDSVGNTSSTTFNVIVRDTIAPVITVPGDIVVYNEEGKNGATVTFSASASDTVSGAITPTANPPSGSTFPIGTTTVTVTAQDAAGNTASRTFEVTVRKTELANIATRVPVGTGERVGIGGFIIRGTDPLRVIVRARGPSMRVNGQPVPGAMEDPKLDLYDSSGSPDPSASNDNWQDSVQRDEIAGSGLAPEDPREAAIIAVLPPGAYTGVLSGANGSTGNALVEVFALPGESNSSLVNISTRGPVLTADDLLIGGVIVRGGTPQRLVFRAIGPDLANRGVAEALQDPRLELRDSNGDLIVSNNSWQESADRDEIDRVNLEPNDPREAAIVRSLGSGDYTAVVRSENGATGVGMVEVYRLE